MRFTEMEENLFRPQLLFLRHGRLRRTPDAESDRDGFGRRRMAQCRRDWHAQRDTATLENRTDSHIRKCFEMQWPR